MTKFEQSKQLNYDVEQLESLILDIEKYPEFLPWCFYAKIISVNDDQSIIADLGVKYSIFEEIYRSHITSNKLESELLIEVKMIQGPFKYLYNSWHLQSTRAGTIIKFTIDFELKSAILNKMLEVVYHRAAQKMIAAFEERAAFLYKNS